MQLLVQNRPMQRGAEDDCLMAHLELSARSHPVPKRSLHIRKAHNTAFLLTGDLLGLLGIALLSEMSLAAAAACLGGFAIRGLYPGWGLDRREEFGRQWATILVVMGLWVLFAPSVSLHMLLALPAALVVLPFIRHSVKKVLLASCVFGMPVAIYGAGSDGRTLVEALRENIDMGLIPVAFLDDHPAYWGAHVQGLPVLGDTNVVLNQAWTGILAMPDVEQEFRQYLMDGPLSCYPYGYDVSDGQNPLDSLRDVACPGIMKRIVGSCWPWPRSEG